MDSIVRKIYQQLINAKKKFAFEKKENYPAILPCYKCMNEAHHFSFVQKLSRRKHYHFDFLNQTKAKRYV